MLVQEQVLRFDYGPFRSIGILGAFTGSLDQAIDAFRAKYASLIFSRTIPQSENGASRLFIAACSTNRQPLSLTIVHIPSLVEASICAQGLGDIVEASVIQLMDALPITGRPPRDAFRKALELDTSIMHQIYQDLLSVTGSAIESSGYLDGVYRNQLEQYGLR